MLKVQNIHKHFGGIQALNDVSFKINEGETLAIIGDNGAGKSTLMKCISGTHNPDTGKILFYNTGIHNATPRQTRSAGIEMLYQNLNLCGQQDVVTNIFLGKEQTKNGLLNKKSMTNIAIDMFKRLNIDIPVSTKVQNLSGGQQQSVAIARAMLSNPKLLIMDEPTAALGVQETRKVLNHIKELKNNNVSIIMITHNLSDVFDVADRIIIMKQGRIHDDLNSKNIDLNDIIEKI